MRWGYGRAKEKGDRRIVTSLLRNATESSVIDHSAVVAFTCMVIHRNKRHFFFLPRVPIPTRLKAPNARNATVVGSGTDPVLNPFRITSE